MTDKPLSNDPGYVFRRVGIGFMVLGCFNASGLVAAMALRGLEVKDRYTLIFVVVAIGLPLLAGLMVAFDPVRDKILDLADRLPFVHFEKAVPTANGENKAE